MSPKEVAIIVVLVMLGSTLGRIIAFHIVDDDSSQTVRIVVEKKVDGQ